MNRETEPAYYRPVVRKLKDLTNEGLQQLYELRASKVKLDPKGMWDDERIVYGATMRKILASLYEVLLEIQSRYPKSLIYGDDGKWDYDDESYGVEASLLPVLPLLQAPGQELEHARRREARRLQNVKCTGSTESNSPEVSAPKPRKLPNGLKLLQGD